jgi:hypothetical protein
MATSLKFFVYENGIQFSVSEMTEPESAAISECVDYLLPRSSNESYWFEADLCLLEKEDEEAPYGRVWCYTHTLAPKNRSTFESRLPHPIPEELKALSGKRFHISPNQYGLSPWQHPVEIHFEILQAS